MDRGPLSSICRPLGTDAEACGPLPQRLYSSRIRCLFPSSLAASAVQRGKNSTYMICAHGSSPPKTVYQVVACSPKCKLRIYGGVGTLIG